MRNFYFLSIAALVLIVVFSDVALARVGSGGPL
jgi:hypothetical protein